MAIRNATITVEAGLAAAYNQAPAPIRKKVMLAMKRALHDVQPTLTTVRHLSRKESSLFLIINEGLPGRDQDRIEELTDKMEFETITKSEHAELLRLTDTMEMAQVKRLKAIAELAKIRNVSLDEMMRQLGLEPGRYAR